MNPTSTSGSRNSKTVSQAKILCFPNVSMEWTKRSVLCFQRIRKNFYFFPLYLFLFLTNIDRHLNNRLKINVYKVQINEFAKNESERVPSLIRQILLWSRSTHVKRCGYKSNKTEQRKTSFIYSKKSPLLLKHCEVELDLKLFMNTKQYW